MQRRQFLGCAAGVAALGVLGRNCLAQEQAAAPVKAPPPTQFVSLRRGVGYFTGRGGTIGWLSSEEGLAAVDTQMPETAAIFLSEMPGRAQRPIDVVFNTHHHGDHTGGNGLFKAASRTIVAHKLVPRFQMRAGERDGNLAKQVFAKELFEQSWRRELGDEMLSAQFAGPAHTGGDSVLRFEKANVVHLGDLVFNRLYPVIDRFGGANIRGWIASLERLIREYPSDAIYLFGHGNPRFGVSGGKAELGVMRDYLSGLLEHVSREIAAGKTRGQLREVANLPGFEDFHLPPGKGNRLPLNLEAAYDELTAPAQA